MSEKKDKYANWRDKKRDYAYALFREGHISEKDLNRILKEIKNEE